jgi:hypothetical protein
VTGVVSGTTRELACLALNHDDGTRPASPQTDEQLMRELLAEVHRLRVAVGEAIEDDDDREDAEAALAQALDDDQLDGVPGGLDLAVALVEVLARDGWHLVRSQA